MRWAGQALLRGLPGTQPVSTAHAVQTADWYRPSRRRTINGGYTTDRRRPAAHTASSAPRPSKRAGPPWLSTGYSLSSRSCCRSLSAMRSSERNKPATSLGWPVLRACVRRLGEHMVATGGSNRQMMMCSSATARKSPPLFGLGRVSRSFTSGAPPPLWQRQRNLVAPLTLGSRFG